MSERNHQNDNAAYYAARAVEERRLAMAAKDLNARAAHLEMAEKYAELGRQGETMIGEEQQKAG